MVNQSPNHQPPDGSPRCHARLGFSKLHGVPHTALVGRLRRRPIVRAEVASVRMSNHLVFPSTSVTVLGERLASY